MNLFYSFSQEIDIDSLFNNTKRSDSINTQYLGQILVLGKDEFYIDSIKQFNRLSVDSILIQLNLGFLCQLNLNEIKRVEEKEGVLYFKCISIDSTEYLSYASISFPINFNGIDSIFQNAQNELNKGINWNDLSIIKFNCRNKRSEEFYGQSGWLRKNKLHPAFVEAYNSIELGKLGIVKIDEFGLGWIVYKLANPKFFTVRTFKLISVPY